MLLYLLNKIHFPVGSIGEVLESHMARMSAQIFSNYSVSHGKTAFYDINKISTSPP